MSSDVKITFNKNVFQSLKDASDKTTYEIARKTLDMVGGSYVVARRSGDTEDSMFTGGLGYQGGVQKDAEGYFIGNYTPYAKYVYEMKNVQWTRKTTQPRWFHFIWQQYGDMITKNCIERYLG